jgi:hypothetical protein
MTEVAVELVPYAFERGDFETGRVTKKLMLSRERMGTRIGHEGTLPNEIHSRLLSE